MTSSVSNSRPSSPTGTLSGVANSSSPSEPSLSRQYDIRPRTLADLNDNRNRLKTSPNKTARNLCSALEDIHNQLHNANISEEKHLAKCFVIREAAEMVNGSLNVEQDTLEKFGLHKQSDLTLRPDEFQAINDDLGRQLDPRNGVLATRERLQEDVIRDSRRGRANFERILANGDPRAHTLVRLDASIAVWRGMSAEQAIADHGLTHPQDTAEMRETAARVAVVGVNYNRRSESILLAGEGYL